MAATISPSVGAGHCVEQADGGHDHARRAVAALEGLLVEERLLDRVERALGGQPLDGLDRLPGDAADRGDAGAGGLAVDQHGAGPARAFAAADLAAGQAEVVAQHAEQGGLCRHVYRHRRAVHL